MPRGCFQDDLIAELRKHGVKDFKVSLGKKHRKLLFTSLLGVKRLYVFPNSPSDRRAIRNAISDLRRLMDIRAAA